MAETSAYPDAAQLARLNETLAQLDAAGRVRYALEHLPARHVITSSFGAQAAACLHLLTRELPDIPVILLDTGYLFPETYQFVEQLTERLGLNLEVYSSRRSPAWQEAADGERWKLGVGSFGAYHRENKLEPLQRALTELRAGTWFTGLRRAQSPIRATTPFVRLTGEHIQVSPIADWSDGDVEHYLYEHDLPRHPLWEQGYVSIGDRHTARV
jgi:phosphoadenosine phosphosulfate reductase